MYSTVQNHIQHTTTWTVQYSTVQYSITYNIQPHAQWTHTTYNHMHNETKGKQTNTIKYKVKSPTKLRGGRRKMNCCDCGQEGHAEWRHSYCKERTLLAGGASDCAENSHTGHTALQDITCSSAATVYTLETWVVSGAQL